MDGLREHCDSTAGRKAPEKRYLEKGRLSEKRDHALFSRGALREYCRNLAAVLREPCGNTARALEEHCGNTADMIWECCGNLELVREYCGIMRECCGNTVEILQENREGTAGRRAPEKRYLQTGKLSEDSDRPAAASLLP